MRRLKDKGVWSSLHAMPFRKTASGYQKLYSALLFAELVKNRVLYSYSPA